MVHATDNLGLHYNDMRRNWKPVTYISHVSSLRSLLNAFCQFNAPEVGPVHLASQCHIHIHGITNAQYGE